jgi:tRNA (Thr-GGU) A37 N-methylase
VRPNPIGLSCVELEKIEFLHDKILIHVHSINIIDQTPILDIKPYQKDMDSIPDAKLA